MSSSLATVYIHPSQFPDCVYQNYLDGFFDREIDNRFHYDSVKQSQKWLKIHQAYSPASGNQDCIQTYERCFEATTNHLDNQSQLQLIALGCGGGEKDSRLLSNLLKQERDITCYPVDVSLSLALISARAMEKVAPQSLVKPIVCNLRSARDLIQIIDREEEKRQKIITFFGMIPNFYPDRILPILSEFLNGEDILLFSANLAPGSNYLQGINKILPQYDNELTRDWLITILIDAGVDIDRGKISVEIEPDETQLEISRIAFYFEVEREIEFKLDDRQVQWQAGTRIRLFFSYRYTTTKIQKILGCYGIKVVESWEDKTQQEGVYLCCKEGTKTW
ncbi:L-histidine N(alpha)-methyltransferase [Oscillatoriales cyanobacterium LEGE 11467]|uniref:L-histidine N(Alpha)-methyltransferase n=1 Tax=Zarconia navalis LEGE 11467 TaxID=1828826 RepID=A0A928Z7E2_9CYAN|nr:L-histidine N(alpha)-methyltransferase [Zarconia navalis]MBE9040450.1 L-histidine N(alpha)-methyltransferase [Zarconia navalis LEGE 11467]